MPHSGRSSENLLDIVQEVIIGRGDLRPSEQKRPFFLFFFFFSFFSGLHECRPFAPCVRRKAQHAAPSLIMSIDGWASPNVVRLYECRGPYSRPKTPEIPREHPARSPSDVLHSPCLACSARRNDAQIETTEHATMTRDVRLRNHPA